MSNDQNPKELIEKAARARLSRRRFAKGLAAAPVAAGVASERLPTYRHPRWKY